jgi:hypothetical protein
MFKSKVAALARRAFSVKALHWYTDRVSTLGIVLPALHFAVLPFSLFAYVFRHFLHANYVRDSAAGTLTFTMSVAEFEGFVWLMDFWLWMAAAALVSAAAYRIVVRAFRHSPHSLMFSKALMAVLLTSGTVERLVADRLVRYPKAFAPVFENSLYHDLGALVRAPMWDIGRYSVFSTYTWLPLSAASVTFAVYVGARIAAEVRIATRARG